MCLIAFAWQRHPDYALVVAANRDEFFARPTREAHWWPQTTLLAGRDEQAGGTWLGVTRTGRFAALTNYRQMIDGQSADGQSERPSRGGLVTDYLLAEDSDEFQRRMAKKSHAYAGFNLLYADAVGADAGMHYFSNRGASQRDLATGTYGLSNALLDEPWPKVAYLTDALSEALEQPALSTESLLDMLDDRRQAADNELPDTGVGLESERMLSPPFIVSPSYGTRCSTSILIGYDGQIRFHERTFDSRGQRTLEREFCWRLDDPSCESTQRRVVST